MKTKIYLIFLVLFFSGLVKIRAANSKQAREILKNNFISLAEAKEIYPDIPENIKIPFSTETLRRNKSAWLVPIKINSGFKYLLIRANFEHEFCALKNIDTLDLKTSTEVLTVLKRLRPKFPERTEADLPFKYFFRTNERYNQKTNYKKTISYDGEKFIQISWPDEIELGVVNKGYIAYLARNKRGVEIKLETTPLPKKPKLEEQSVLVLTLFKCL